MEQLQNQWSAGKTWIDCMFRQSNWGMTPSLEQHEEAVEELNLIPASSGRPQIHERLWNLPFLIRRVVGQKQCVEGTG